MGKFITSRLNEKFKSVIRILFASLIGRLKYNTFITLSSAFVK